MVNPKLVLIAIGALVFVFLGGVGKTKTALEVAKADLSLVKTKTTDFVNDIKEKNKAGMEGKEAWQI